MQSIMHNCKISRFRLLYVCMHVCMYVNKHLHVLQQVAQLIRDVMPEDLSAGKTSERPFLLFPQWEWVLAVVVRSIATPYYVFVSSYVCMYVCMYVYCLCMYLCISKCVCLLGVCKSGRFVRLVQDSCMYVYVCIWVAGVPSCGSRHRAELRIHQSEQDPFVGCGGHHFHCQCNHSIPVAVCSCCCSCCCCCCYSCCCSSRSCSSASISLCVLLPPVKQKLVLNFIKRVNYY